VIRISVMGYSQKKTRAAMQASYRRSPLRGRGDGY
jgi:hypothetical protein